MVARGRASFSNSAFPIEGHSHADAHRYHVDRGQLLIDDKPLETPAKFAGYQWASQGARAGVLLVNNGLHVEPGLRPDAPDRLARPGGGWPMCGWKPLFPRSWIARTSVACVDAEDKVLAYGNWLGADAGRPDRNLREGRGRDEPARCRPTSTTWRPMAAPMTVKGRAPDAGAQRGPPDDEPRDPARGWLGGLRGG